MRPIRTPPDWRARERLLPPAPGAARASSGRRPYGPYASRRTRWRRVVHLAVFCALWLALLAWPEPQIVSFLSTHFASPALKLIGRSVSTLPGGVETFAISTGPHQYWQVGLAADGDSSHATGLRATIQTRVPQRVSHDTTNYFWVGSYLSDGSFLQVGYFVPWYDQAHAGWFYCAFSSTGHQGPCRYGSLGSAGANASLHDYTLEAIADASGHKSVWRAEFDGAQIGQFVWSAADSGSSAPVIYAESSGFAKHDSSSQLGPVDFAGGLEVRPAGQISYTHVSHVLVMYSASDVCPPYGIARDGHGGALIGSGLACPDRWGQLW